MDRLEMVAVSRRFRNDPGVSDLVLTVAAGEIVALVGLNGAGKTTLLKLATAMLRCDRGQILIDGVDVARVTARGWGTVGHFIDGPALYSELTVRQNLRFADRTVRQLSLGNRQRAGLAAALQHSPTLLMLDEPANSLDPAGVLVLRDRLLELRTAGAGVLISSHHLDEVARLADRILVMNRGCLIGELAPGGDDLERALFARLHEDDVERHSS